MKNMKINKWPNSHLIFTFFIENKNDASSCSLQSDASSHGHYLCMTPREPSLAAWGAVVAAIQKVGLWQCHQFCSL